MRYFIILILLFTISIQGYSQKSRKKKKKRPQTEISSKPIDTLLLNERQVVLFTNGTWKYIPRKNTFDFAVNASDTLRVFREYWSNTLLFPYKKPDPSGDTIITLVDSLRKFVHPNPNVIIGEYKQRRSHFHGAWDLALLPGTPIKAAFDGKVRIAEYNRGGYGYLIIIRHFNGLETYYSHLSKLEVVPNEIVKAGDIIGLGGNTGRASAFHLHFEVRYHDRTINPHELINAKTYQLKTNKLVIKKAGIKSFTDPVIEDEEIANDSLFSSKSLATIAAATPENVLTSMATMAAVKTKEKLDKAKAEKAKYHTVVNGDNLSKIAKRYGISVKELCKINGIKETAVLQLGKKLKVKP